MPFARLFFFAKYLEAWDKLSPASTKLKRSFFISNLSNSKFSLSLFSPFITTVISPNISLSEKYSITSNEEVVIRSVKSAFQLENNDLIFATEREQCVGGCFGADPCFDIEMDDTDYNKLKQIFKDYDSEEEEVSKTIRCIINFIEEEPESISIWF